MIRRYTKLFLINFSLLLGLGFSLMVSILFFLKMNNYIVDIYEMHPNANPNSYNGKKIYIILITVFMTLSFIFLWINMLKDNYKESNRYTPYIISIFVSFLIFGFFAFLSIPNIMNKGFQNIEIIKRDNRELYDSILNEWENTHIPLMIYIIFGMIFLYILISVVIIIMTITYNKHNGKSRIVMMSSRANEKTQKFSSRY